MEFIKDEMRKHIKPSYLHTVIVITVLQEGGLFSQVLDKNETAGCRT
jgi:hypothetical protein